MRSDRIIAVVVSFVVGGGLAVVRATPASACIGGMDIGWTVERAAGIARATVVSAELLPDFRSRLVVSDVSVVRGDVTIPREVTVSMGDICEQSADAGETVLLLDGVTGLVPSAPVGPYAFVIEGPDALPASAVTAALGALPPTDTLRLRSERAADGDWPAAILLAGLGSLVYTLRRRQRPIRS